MHIDVTYNILAMDLRSLPLQYKVRRSYRLVISETNTTAFHAAITARNDGLPALPLVRISTGTNAKTNPL